MKPKQFERSYRDTPAPKAGVQFIGSNKTAIIRTVGMIGMNCDYCGTSYETYACWAKRVNRHFCSHSCAGKFKQEPIDKSCEICGDKFTVHGVARAARSATCSRKCHNIKYSKMLKERVIPMNNNLQGEKCSWAELKESDINAIRNDTRPQTTIAKEYGVTQSTISSIKLGKSWKHIPFEGKQNEL